MAAIVDRLKKEIKKHNGNTAGIQTISEALQVLEANKSHDIAENINNVHIEISEHE